MTLPAAFPLSMSQIATELGLILPLSLNHAWVLKLAQKAGLPVSFSDLLSKTGRLDGSFASSQQGSGSSTHYSVNFASAPFFGGTLAGLDVAISTAALTLSTNLAPNWATNISVKNNTTGASAILSYAAGSPPIWTGTDTSGGSLVRAPNANDSFTVLPSN